MSECPYLLRAAQIAAQAQPHAHPWNPNSQLVGLQLSRATGMTRTGVSLVRIPPGKESFIYHSHTFEEEWIYVLAGRGVAQINDAEYEVAAGDFMGFPAPGVAHHMRNPFEQPLIYLVGGENRDFEIAEFPTLGKRMVRTGTQVQVYDVDDAQPFGPLK